VYGVVAEKVEPKEDRARACRFSWQEDEQIHSWAGGGREAHHDLPAGGSAVECGAVEDLIQDQL
jgi:hypothetical protein